MKADWLDELNLKVIWKSKWPRMSKGTLQSKSKTERLLPADIKTHCNDLAINSAWHLCRWTSKTLKQNRDADRQEKETKMEILKQTHAYMTGAMTHQREKNSVFKWCWGNWVSVAKGTKKGRKERREGGGGNHTPISHKSQH